VTATALAASAAFTAFVASTAFVAFTAFTATRRIPRPHIESCSSRMSLGGLGRFGIERRRKRRNEYAVTRQRRGGCTGSFFDDAETLSERFALGVHQKSDRRVSVLEDQRLLFRRHVL